MTSGSQVETPETMHTETSLVQQGMGSQMPALRHTHQGLKTPRRAVTFADGEDKLTAALAFQAMPCRRIPLN